MIHLLPGSADKPEVPDWPACFTELAGSARHEGLRRFYQAGIPAANTPLSQVPMLAMDFETTGLDANAHSIISIGLVPFTLERIRLGESQQWLLKPRMPLEHQSITIHGITHSDISRAPDLSEHLDELLGAMAGKVIVVHYRNIERPFLDIALKARIGEGIQFPVIDTMELEARLHRKASRGLLDRLLGKKPASIRLAASRERYNLPHYGAHHAVTDALSTAELLQAQVAHRFAPETPVSQFWL